MPAETSHFHDYVCLGAAGGKECMVTMKKILMMILTVFMFLGVFQNEVCAAGMSVSANKKQITIGESFKVTVTASDCYATISASTDNGSISGGASDLDIPGSSTSTTLTVKPASTGTCTVTVKGTYASYSDNSFTDVAYSKSVSVKVVDKASSVPSTTPSTTPSTSQSKPTQTQPTTPKPADTRSKENSLSALKVTGGELNPVFSASTTNYTVNLPAEQTSFTIQAIAKDNKAKITGSGEKNVKVGHNIFTIICTAENGSQKEYKIDAYVDESPLVFVEYQKSQLGVVRVLDEIKIPAGFEETKTTLDQHEIPAWINSQLGITICYMQDKDNKKAFYVVEDGKIIYQFLDLQIDGRSFVIMPIDENMKNREGFTLTKIHIQDMELDGWIYDDETMKAYSQLYLMNENGEKCIYNYETTEQQLQKYIEPKEAKKVNVFMITTGVLTVALAGMIILYIQLKRKSKSQ